MASVQGNHYPEVRKIIRALYEEVRNGEEGEQGKRRTLLPSLRRF